MTLVGMLRARSDVLRADMQRFYGLDIDEIGYSIRIMRAADLAANLPHEALIWSVFDERNAWTTNTYLLALIADNTSFLAWSKTKDATRKGAKFKSQIPRPGSKRSKQNSDVKAVDVDTLAEFLKR